MATIVTEARQCRRMVTIVTDEARRVVMVMTDEVMRRLNMARLPYWLSLKYDHSTIQGTVPGTI